MPKPCSQPSNCAYPAGVAGNSDTPSSPPIPSSAAATWTSAWVSTPPVMAGALYHGQRSSLSWLRDGTHPLAAGLGTLASYPGQAEPGRHRRWVPKNLGPGRQVVSQDNQRRQPISRSGRDPGHRPYARTRPNPRKQGRKHTSTSSLPNRGGRELRLPRGWRQADHPPMGEPSVKRAWWAGPVTCWVAGLGVRDCVLAFPAAAGFVPPRGPWVKLERPQRERPSGRGRGRTSLTPASGGR